jgi:hypothetical protein
MNCFARPEVKPMAAGKPKPAVSAGFAQTSPGLWTIVEKMKRHWKERFT